MNLDAAFGRVLLIALPAMPGNSDEQRPAAGCLLPYPLGNRPAVHSGQADVEQHNVRLMGQRRPEGSRAVPGHLDLMAPQVQEQGRAGRAVLMVFGQEYPQSHDVMICFVRAAVAPRRLWRAFGCAFTYRKERK
jgi:hypothetical protein